MWKYLIPALLYVQLGSSLNENESCVDNTNAVGTCKKLVYCESVTEEFKLNGIQPKICATTSDGSVIVCCRKSPSNLADDTNSRPTRADSGTTVPSLLENVKEGAWQNDKEISNFHTTLRFDAQTFLPTLPFRSFPAIRRRRSGNSGYYSCNTNEYGDTSCVIVDTSFTSGKKPEEKRKKIIKIGAPPGFMPDNGTGSYDVYSVYKGSVEDKFSSDDDEELEGGRWGVVFQNEVYIIKYLYQDKDGNDAHVMYYWLGKDVSSQDKRTGERIARRKADKLEGETTVVKVLQGAEPPHFLKMFNNNFIVLLTDEYDKDVDGVRLFRVHGSKKDEDMRVTTLKKKKENLEDDGVFVLDTFGPIYVWRGRDSTTMEQEAGIDFVKQFSQSTPAIVTVAENQEPDIITVEQGKEPQAFWDALLTSPASEAPSSTSVPPSTTSVPPSTTSVPPSTTSVPSSTSLASSKATFPPRTTLADIEEPWYEPIDVATPVVTRAPSSSVSYGSGNDGFTLYEAIVRLRGAVRFENIPDFTQEDLAQDGAYILDTGEELYLWLGASLPERVKNAKHIIVEAYRKRDAVERTEAVFTIPQGREPALFKRIFPSWDPNLFKNAVLSAQAGIYGV